MLEISKESCVGSNLLEPIQYTVSKASIRTKVDLDSYKDLLLEVAPAFDGAIIDGFTIIGKLTTFQVYVATKPDSDSTYYQIKLSRKKGGVAKKVTIKKPKSTIVQKVQKDLSKMNLTTKKLRDVHFDDSLFIPMKSETAIDYCFSNEGGVMPGTNYILIGDPGIGKSSVSIEYASRIQDVNPDKKVLFVSAEMTELDMIPYTKRFPLWLDLETLFVSDLTEGLYKESIVAKFSEGFDLILIDSFAELSDSIRGDYNESVSGKDKKSYNDIEKFLVDLMVTNNKGLNDQKKNTSFIAIQQMTKGGDFVGSNKLKHNTTGMIELRYTKSGARKIVVSKNRRGFEYDNLYFDFTTNTNSPIFYDLDRIKRDKKVQEEIRKAATEQLEEEKATDTWFESIGANVDETPKSEEEISFASITV